MHLRYNKFRDDAITAGLLTVSNNKLYDVSGKKINFNNESGYRTVAWNTETSYSFSTEGIKDVYFRIIYTDNSTYTARTKISVTKEPAAQLRSDASTRINATSNRLKLIVR